MSRENDFFGDYDESPDNAGTGQEDTSEPLISPADTEPEPAIGEPKRPARPRPRAKKKAKTRPKAKAMKKPAPKKKAKKKATAAKKKKAAKPKRKK